MLRPGLNGTSNGQTMGYSKSKVMGGVRNETGDWTGSGQLLGTITTPGITLKVFMSLTHSWHLSGLYHKYRINVTAN